MLPALTSGLLFSLSLVVAIGPQNLFVLRQASRRRHVALVVAICVISDAVLIVAGVAGAGAALAGRAGLIAAVRAGGAVLVFGYGALAVRRAMRPARLNDGGAAGSSSRACTAATCLAFTWLNPAVYLDTVVLLGSVAASHGGARWWFAVGAIVASALWFVALGGGARKLGAALRHPRTARWLDGFIALVMASTGLRMLL